MIGECPIKVDGAAFKKKKKKNYGHNILLQFNLFNRLSIYCMR
jgi:hypothetical protein